MSTLATDLLFIRMETSACKSSRFKEPVSDALEEEMCTNAVPDKTKAVTAWGIGIYTEWAAQRASKTSSVSGVRDLETPLLSMRSEELSYEFAKPMIGLANSYWRLERRMGTLD